MKYLILLLFAFNVIAYETYANIETINGKDYLYVSNYERHSVYCYVNSMAGHYEFKVAPESESRRYPVYGKYSWGCD